MLRTLTPILLAWAAIAPAPAAADAPAGERPNILFVFSDDHAAQAIGAYGSRINKTPNIDRLAAEGMRFGNCFCGNSICAPSRATVLTGMHSHRNGVIDNGAVFDGSQTTFPKLLQAAGYQTALIGKWHLKSDPTGFDHWEVLIGQGPYYNPPMRTPGGRREHTGYTTEIITDLALEWLREERDPERPFLLMYQHKAPHREWEPGPRQLSLYDEVEIPEPATLLDDYAGRSGAARSQEMTLARHLSPRDLKLVPPPRLNEEQLTLWNAAYGPKNAAFEAAGLEGEELVRWRYQRYVKDYVRCVASVDENLGRVLDYLAESGLEENTIVVYSSDQGFYLGEHGWYDKRWMYEESLRMPLIVRWPGTIAPGAVEERLVSNIDFAPTFLEAAGVAIPGEVQGESLLGLLRGEEPEGWRESVYYHYYEFPGVHAVQRHYGVRDERYKLIHYYQIDEWELFDLECDPSELTSVHAEPAYAAVRVRLEAQLARLGELYGEAPPSGIGGGSR
ncbi:MAG: sulfatase [Planctomycetes bacterium]|nr:sulfatase [Planctomycetota bacterium]MDP6410587.1 sulfatase [Planctomycetota bacterium]